MREQLSIGRQPRAWSTLGTSKVSDARISSPLPAQNGALTFKARAKEGPSKPAKPQAPSMAHPHFLPPHSRACADLLNAWPGHGNQPVQPEPAQALDQVGIKTQTLLSQLGGWALAGPSGPRVGPESGGLHVAIPMAPPWFLNISLQMWRVQ